MAGLGGLGFFAGGAAQGYDQASQSASLNNYRTQELQIQQQAQQNAEKRQQFEQVQKIENDYWKTIDTYVEQAKIANPNMSNQDILKPIQPTLTALSKLKVSSGQPDDVTARMAALLAMPPATKTEAAMAAAKERPETKVLTSASGDQSVVFANPRAGTVTRAPSGTTAQASPDVSSDEPAAQGAVMLSNLAKNSGMTPEQLDVDGRALAGGNTSVLTNRGRGRQSAAQINAIRAWADHVLVNDQGLTTQQAAETLSANTAEYKGTVAGAGALGRREAQVIGAATTATQTAPRVLAASEAVSRTDYPSLNSVLMAWRQGTGDENVIRLGIAVNTFVNNYARALGAGNAAITDSARREAFENLSTAWSKGQIKSAVDQMLNKELPSEITGAKMGMKEFLSQGRKPASGQTSKPAYKFNPDTGELE
jgi:hypothetical protein